VSVPHPPAPPAPADLVIRNGQVVTAHGVVEADVAVTAGTIVSVAAPSLGLQAR
jgi:urease alpha subunit